MFEKEECWIIFGIKVDSCVFGFLKYQGKGSWGAVDFVWEKATSKFLQGFHHTHPDGITQPSGRDDKTMSAWIRAEGKPLILGVKSGDSLKFFLYEKMGALFTKREIVSKLYHDIFFIGNVD